MTSSLGELRYKHQEENQQREEGGGATYQSKATWTLASASSPLPLQHKEEEHGSSITAMSHGGRGVVRRTLGE